MLSLLMAVAFALCPSSVVLYDIGAGLRGDLSTDEILREAACRDLPDVAAWNRMLDEKCMYRARMRDGRLHLDEAHRKDGECIAIASSAQSLQRQTPWKAGRYKVTDLLGRFILLRGDVPQISPWHPGFDHEDWPDVSLPQDEPTYEALLDVVYPDGWEVVAARHVNSRVQPLGTEARMRNLYPHLDDVLRGQLCDLYQQRLEKKITHAHMRDRVAKIMEVLEARAAAGRAPTPGER